MLVAVQHWVQDRLSLKLPLLDGAFLLAPSTALTAPAAAAAIPWRLRQIAAVEAGSKGSYPESATVVLVGGDRLAAGDVGCGSLQEVDNCEVRGNSSSNKCRCYPRVAAPVLGGVCASAALRWPATRSLNRARVAAFCFCFSCTV